MKTLFILLFSLGAPEVILILIAILLLFGAKRIPELMKSLGKGVKNFKQGMAEAEEEITKDVVENESTKTDKEEKEKKANKTKKTTKTTKTTKKA